MPPGEMDAAEAVATVLRRSGATCHDLASAADWLQDQLGSLVGTGRIQPCRETTMAMQELDRIAQVLRGLADLHIELGEHTGELYAPRGRLLAAVRLDSLAARLLEGHAVHHDSEDELWG